MTTTPILTPSEHTPDLTALFSLFSSDSEKSVFEPVPGPAVPQPYHDLLVHEHHMTVTVEAFHGGAVDVRVLKERRDGDDYARKILLALHDTGRVVQFGIVRIHLNFCGEAVRDAILAGKTPLGRVLIQHNVLRRIQPVAFMRVLPSLRMQEWFGITHPTPTYGRLALIHCDDRPAVELIEIVAPVTG